MNAETPAGFVHNEDAADAVPSGAAMPAMRGITVGSLNASATGAQPEEIHHAVQGQALGAALFVSGLLPPILMSLLFGLSHRAHWISQSRVWAWSAAVIALVAVVQAVIRPLLQSRSAVAWMRPVLIALLVLAPSATVLYLRMMVHVAPLPLVVAQIALYGLSLVVLLFSSLSAAE